MAQTFERNAARLGDALSEAERSIDRIRYKIARLLADTKHVYGAGLALRLATLVQVDVTTLYRWRDIALAWDEPVFEALLAQGLAWSHLIELCRLKEKGARDRLVRIAIREGLSSRAIRKRISAGARARG